MTIPLGCTDVIHKISRKNNVSSTSSFLLSNYGKDFFDWTIPAPRQIPRKMIRHGVELSLIYSFSSPDLRRSLSESHLLQNCNPGGENDNDKKNSADTILR